MAEIRWQSFLLSAGFVWRKGEKNVRAGRGAEKSKLPRKGGRFDAGGKVLRAQRDNVRTLVRKKRNSRNFNIPSYEEGTKFAWHVPLHDLLLHVRECQTECPQLNLTLDKLFGMISAYQLEAA
jgi:hypothetical protein